MCIHIYDHMNIHLAPWYFWDTRCNTYASTSTQKFNTFIFQYPKRNMSAYGTREWNNFLYQGTMLWIHHLPIRRCVCWKCTSLYVLDNPNGKQVLVGFAGMSMVFTVEWVGEVLVFLPCPTWTSRKYNTGPKLGMGYGGTDLMMVNCIPSIHIC
jgi:hypothetical protein